MKLSHASVLMCILAAGCGGGEGGPPVKKTGQGGTAGSTGGGSGGVGGQADAGPGGTAGAGGSGGSGGVTKKDLPNCDALCAWEVQVSGDCPADALTQCKAAFQISVLGMDAACVTVAEAWCKCLSDNTDPSVVSCTGGPVTSNIPVINGLPATCSAESDAWVQCNQ